MQSRFDRSISPTIGPSTSARKSNTSGAAMVQRCTVIGLSGVPGSGKSTLSGLLLRELPSAKILSYDRFHPRMSNAQVEDWLERGGDPNEMALENLVAALKDLTLGAGDGTRSPILFETAFGRAHRASGAFINFSVWIDTPLDIAMSRVTRVFLRNAELDPSPTAAADLIPRLSRYMVDYPMLRRMYVRVSETGKVSADLVVDGTPPAEEIAAQIAIALADRGISV
jgi:uridine kinase